MNGPLAHHIAGVFQRMKISICIPQYNRTEYLLLALESIRSQSYRDIEIVVSDDCSTDESHHAIPAALQQTGLEYQYLWQEENLGYDKNLRVALEAATGDYLFIMGNDDVLAGDRVIEELLELLKSADFPEIAMGNVPDWMDQASTQRRCYSTGVVGSGIETALRVFRSFTVVTGLIIRRDVFQKVNTCKYDGSIYVQVYLMTRAIAQGGRLLMIDRPVAFLGVHVEGKHANSWIDVLRGRGTRIGPVEGGLGAMTRTAADALTADCQPKRAEDLRKRAFRQTLSFSYPFWLYEYRRQGFPVWAFNLALGCSPGRLLKGQKVGAWGKLALWWVYLRSTVGGLVLPTKVLALLSRKFHRRSKLQQNSRA